eukprot:357022-Chlamydomonas_euryale.AAC.9
MGPRSGLIMCSTVAAALRRRYPWHRCSGMITLGTNALEWCSRLPLAPMLWNGVLDYPWHQCSGMRPTLSPPQAQQSVWGIKYALLSCLASFDENAGCLEPSVDASDDKACALMQHGGQTACESQKLDDTQKHWHPCEYEPFAVFLGRPHGGAT